MVVLDLARDPARGRHRRHRVLRHSRIQLYRQAKRAGAKITAEMDRISDVTAEIERHIGEGARLPRSGSTVRRAGSRVSRARLDVQLAAIREARAQLRRTFWFVPGI